MTDPLAPVPYSEQVRTWWTLKVPLLLKQKLIKLITHKFGRKNVRTKLVELLERYADKLEKGNE